ncbi:MAG: LysM peptidoglycan-binding domain-containing protein [Chloroflexi bacterium]|nr:LysM peptidoglycan-binding domain-containing protein [Chloroflexota bacterium]
MSRNRSAIILLGCVGALVLLFTLRGLVAVRAQGTELLTNNGMDSYVGGPGGVVPTGWTLTANVPVNSSKQDWVFNEFPGFGSSWKVDTSGYAFTMNAYQFVPGVRAGTPLVFTAYANVFTCNREDSCIGANTPRTSQRESGARTRIGIDPTGGRDPNAPTVKWSEYIQPFDQFLPMTVEARSENDNGVTVFLHATQSVGMLLNHVYWDNVSLRAGVGSGGAVPAPRREAPPVTPQKPQPDGSIIHVVQEGDTLSTIALAYGVTVAELRRLNNIPPEEYVIRIGQRLIVKTPPPNVTYIVVTATPTPDPNLSPTPTATPFIVLPTNTPIGIIPITIVPITVAPNTPVALDPTATAVPAAPRLRIPTQDPRRIVTVPIRPRSTFVPPAESGSQLLVVSDSLSETPSPPSAPSNTAQPTQVAATIPIIALEMLPPDQTRLCALAFDDANTNRLRDQGEPLLVGMRVSLLQNGAEVQALSTAALAPTCFTSIPPGNYTLLAAPPETYGMTTPRQLQVQVERGVALTVSFGAAGSYQPTSLPAALESPPPSNTAQHDAQRGPLLAFLLDNFGLVIFSLAGLSLVGGLSIAIVTRRG